MITKKIEAGVGSKINYKIFKEGYKTIDTTFDVTENLDTDTILDLSPSSTIYETDLDYSINQDLEAAPLMNLSDVTLPNDVIVTGENKLWYPYAGGKLYKYPKSDIIEKNNFNIMGNPNFTNKVISNLTNSQYVFTQTFQFDDTVDTFAVDTYVKLSSLSTYTFIFTSSSTSGGAATQDSMWKTNSSNGNQTGGSLSANKWYHIVLEQTGDSSKLYVDDQLVITAGKCFYNGDCINFGKSNWEPFYNGFIDFSKTLIKINDEIVWKPEISDYEVNSTQIGSVIINKDWNVSGFSSSNYLRIPSQSFGSANDWEMLFKVKTGNSTSTNQKVFHTCSGTGSSGRYGIGVIVIDNHFGFFLSSNNSSWLFDLTGSYRVLPNTTYYIKASFSGTQYKLSYSLDNVTFIDDIIYDSTSKVYSSLPNAYIGIYSTSGFQDPWLGTIDLNECYIKIDNEIVWKGIKYKEYNIDYTVVGNPTISSDQVISNMTTSNYLNIPYLNMDSISYEICCEFTLQNTYSDYRCFFVYGPQNARFNMAITNDAQPRVHSNTGNGSSWYTSIIGTTPLELNKSYLVKCCRSNGVRTMYLSADKGKTWSNEGSISDTYTYSNTYHIGQAQNTSPCPNMSMDLKQCYVKIDDIEVWRGATKNSSYYHGIMDTIDDYNPQGGTYKLFSCHKDDEEVLIATSQDVPTEENNYYQYIQEITIPEFIEYQYTNDDKWIEVIDDEMM